jgi:hypothetical protein
LRPGEIYNLRPPTGDPTLTPRPVLVLSVSPPDPGQDQVALFAEISTAQRLFEARYIGDIEIDEWQNCGLTEPSVLRARHFTSGPQSWLTGPLGVVDLETLCEARRIAKAMFDFDA